VLPRVVPAYGARLVDTMNVTSSCRAGVLCTIIFSLSRVWRCYTRPDTGTGDLLLPRCPSLLSRSTPSLSSSSCSGGCMYTCVCILVPLLSAEQQQCIRSLFHSGWVVTTGSVLQQPLYLVILQYYNRITA
jgi:hypothetical protein